MLMHAQMFLSILAATLKSYHGFKVVLMITIYSTKRPKIRYIIFEQSLTTFLFWWILVLNLSNMTIGQWKFNRLITSTSVHRMLRVLLLLLLLILLLLLLCQVFPPPHYQLVGTPNVSLSHSPQTVGLHATCHLLTTTYHLPTATCQLTTARIFCWPKNMFCQKKLCPKFFLSS